MIIEGEVEEVVVEEAHNGGVAGGIDEEELVDTMRALNIAHFAEVSTTIYWPAVLLVCRLSSQY